MVLATLVLKKLTRLF